MKPLLNFLLTALVLTASACSVYDSSLMENGLATVPDRPPSSTSSKADDVEAVFAFRNVSLDQSGDRWRRIGLDLDGMNTTSIARCRRMRGGQRESAARWTQGNRQRLRPVRSSDGGELDLVPRRQHRAQSRTRPGHSVASAARMERHAQRREGGCIGALCRRRNLTRRCIRRGMGWPRWVEPHASGSDRRRAGSRLGRRGLLLRGPVELGRRRSSTARRCGRPTHTSAAAASCFPWIRPPPSSF